MTNPMLSNVLCPIDKAASPIPIWLVAGEEAIAALPLSEAMLSWLKATGFKAQAKSMALVPESDGEVAAVVFGLGGRTVGEPAGPPELLAGSLAKALPPGDYYFAGPHGDSEHTAIAWGLGAYRFGKYKSKSDDQALACLHVSSGLSFSRIAAIVGAVWRTRDLINTPANDMGPQELEAALRNLAATYGAKVETTTGDALLAGNYPLIHTVGRASDRPPCLVDMTWGDSTAPKVTLVGKGICFDTGGLDLKPAGAMLNMKKDMGGAANVIGLAEMIMALGLKVRLRVLVAAAENAVAGNAFRPKDVITSRLGTTVEIGNTDAEGRLVLADALALGDEEKPDLMISMATLTGAARVAMGPELSPFFCDDDALSDQLVTAGAAVGDPLWRLPFWDGYDAALESDIADINNISELGSGGAIIAALFLRRFVKAASTYAHLDIYGWSPKITPLGPKGGEAQGIRALLQVIEQMASTGRT